MTQPNKVNLFDQFEKTAKNSEGLKHLERTTISLKEEQRTKNCIAVVTPTEHRAIRTYSRDLEEQLDQRVTVSDLARELFLLVLGDEAGNQEIRDTLINQLKKNI
jgi:GTPase Era involved in 16S rRNA processing